MSKISETTKRALQIFIDSGGRIDKKMSDIGYMLYPDTDTSSNKNGSRSTQGMALAGGKVMYRLVGLGFLEKLGGKNGISIYKLTHKGRSAMSEAALSHE